MTLASADQAPASGVLARWDTSDVPAGIYRIRLVVNDRYLGEIVQEIEVALPQD